MATVAKQMSSLRNHTFIPALPPYLKTKVRYLLDVNYMIRAVTELWISIHNSE